MAFLWSKYRFACYRYRAVFVSLFLSLEEAYLIYGSVLSCLLDYISIQTDKNTRGSQRSRFEAFSLCKNLDFANHGEHSLYGHQILKQLAI